MNVDSRYKTNDSVSNSDFRFELKEALDLPDNTVCYIDDILIHKTWITHYILLLPKWTPVFQLGTIH